MPMALPTALPKQLPTAESSWRGRNRPPRFSWKWAYSERGGPCLGVLCLAQEIAQPALPTPQRRRTRANRGCPDLARTLSRCRVGGNEAQIGAPKTAIQALELQSYLLRFGGTGVGARRAPVRPNLRRDDWRDDWRPRHGF